MHASDFQAGLQMAYRKGKQLGVAERVELLALVKRGRQAHIKVRWIDGEAAGVEAFARPGELLCPWKAWPKLQRDERREAALIVHFDTHPVVDHVICRAAGHVFTATGEPGLHVDEYRGYTRWLDVAGLGRVATRAGLAPDFWTGGLNFVSHSGGVLINDSLVRLARTFATAEPETVNLALDLQEHRLKVSGYEVGEAWRHQELLERKPEFSVARQWAAERGRQDLQSEVERLRGLLDEAIRALRRHDLERDARRLERGLRGV